MNLILSLILFFLILPAESSEGDAFTARTFDYLDQTNEINSEINKRIKQTITEINKRNHNCNFELLIQEFANNFVRPIVGVFEYWAISNEKLKGHHVKYKDSIYQEISIVENLPVHFGKIGMATFFKINGVLVSSDKLGHFFDEGYTYFRLMTKKNKTLEDVLKYGFELEKDWQGFVRTKVFSYADLVANRNGLDFWLSLSSDKNVNNYLKCERNKFELVRKFDFADYVDTAWDESVNCNVYATESIRLKVEKEINRLSKKYKKNFTCSIEKEKCLGLAKTKYKVGVNLLISPECLK